jgi:DNA recombination protein RmuC
MEAWQRNVLLVSPSTLLFVVRTIAHLWRQEAQTRNAQDIAKRGAELYDKLSAFVADLQKVGAKLKDAQSAYDDAEKKLSTGNGNAIRQAEMLKKLGVKATKALPAALVDAAQDDGGLPSLANDVAAAAPSLFDGLESDPPLA